MTIATLNSKKILFLRKKDVFYIIYLKILFFNVFIAVLSKAD